MQRILEPEVMDTWEESVEYDAMDFTEVNTAFADLAVLLGPPAGLILDAGTGPARIPILLAQRCLQWQIIGTDLSKNMLRLGKENVQQAGLSDRITLSFADAKQLPYPDAHFDMVVSNSLVHHLPDPSHFIQELRRVVKPGGAILLRDLLRPVDEASVDAIVHSIGTAYDEKQTQLFRDSLCAALRLEEVSQLLAQAGLVDVRLYQSSDRHWTAERSWRKA